MAAMPARSMARATTPTRAPSRGAPLRLVFSRKASDEQRRTQATQDLQRFQFLLNVQRLWAVEWQEIADYTLPRKNSIIVKRIPGSKRTQRLFESTALNGRNKLANAIHGGLTSSYVRWFFLETDDDELNQDYDTLVWLDQVGRLLLADFNKSNFAQEINEAYIDLVTFASTCTFMEEKDPLRGGRYGGLNFATQQIGTYAWSEGQDGRVNTLFRELFMSRDAVRDKWPDTPEEALKTDPGQSDELVSVIHAVLPQPGGKMWDSRYILTDGKWMLDESKFNEFPFLCMRWSKASGETYGRGPTHDALPDIRSLNKLREMQLRALPKIIDPPLTAVNGDVIGPARLTPGGVTTVRGSRDAIGPMLSGVDLRQAGMAEDELRRSIKATYQEEIIDFAQQGVGPQMTAFEVAQRRELMQTLMGPTLGRVEREGLSPAITRAFNLRRNANALPPLPASLQMALARKKIGLNISYNGTIARAQRASENDAIGKLTDYIAKVAVFDPAVVDTVDFDEAARASAKNWGAPANIVRDGQQTDKVRTVKAQQAAAQQQAAQAAQAAQSAGAAAPMLKAAGKAPEPGSPLEAAQNGQQPGQAAA